MTLEIDIFNYHKKPTMEKEKEITWRTAFMEIALRAFRKLHIEYGAWGIGQSTNTVSDWENLNVGHGIELALETSVCAAISHEFINSPLTNGLYIKSNDYEERRYEINREVTIGSKRFDFFITRYKKDSFGDVLFYKYPAIIQAKRAHYFSSDITRGIRNELVEKIEGDNGLKADLIKLRQGRDIIKLKNYTVRKSEHDNQYINNQWDNAFLYLLFWGISNKDNNSSFGNEPIAITNRIENGLLKDNNYVLKWMPLKWRNVSNKGNSECPEVFEWIWIMLIEVDEVDIGSPPITPEYWFSKND
jgi:hypothetical protein